MAMPEPARALVVARSEALRILVGDALRSVAAACGSAVEVTEVADGFLALGRVGRERFDFVITDVDLPVLPADELIRYLRARPEQASVPIVAVGAGAPEGDSRLPGGAALAPSPFTADALRSALARAGFRFEGDA
jgi:two-component system, chemotaxis family, chemotaxis protein CheY